MGLLLKSCVDHALVGNMTQQVQTYEEEHGHLADDIKREHKLLANVFVRLTWSTQDFRCFPRPFI